MQTVPKTGMITDNHGLPGFNGQSQAFHKFPVTINGTMVWNVDGS
jgi:hypothetical protein